MFPSSAAQPPPQRIILWDPVCLRTFYAHVASVKMSLCSSPQVQLSSTYFFNIIIDFIDLYQHTQTFSWQLNQVLEYNQDILSMSTFLGCCGEGTCSIQMFRALVPWEQQFCSDTGPYSTPFVLTEGQTQPTMIMN